MALRSRQLQTFATLKQLAKLYRCAQGYNQGLYPHVWYIIFHNLQWWCMYDTSFFMIFWARHNDDGPTTDFHHPTPTPPTILLILEIFLPPCMIHHFSWFFEPETIMIVPQLISTTPPAAHPKLTNFLTPMIFWAWCNAKKCWKKIWHCL